MPVPFITPWPWAAWGGMASVRCERWPSRPKSQAHASLAIRGWRPLVARDTRQIRCVAGGGLLLQLLQGYILIQCPVAAPLPSHGAFITARACTYIRVYTRDAYPACAAPLWAVPVCLFIALRPEHAPPAGTTAAGTARGGCRASTREGGRRAVLLETCGSLVAACFAQLPDGLHRDASPCACQVMG